MGVKVAPYINGRIFDKATDSWKANDNFALKQAAKNNNGFLNITADQLTTYDESYGSLAQQAVMCPFTAYWQDQIAEVCDKLVNFFGVDAVYIDQVASAGAPRCWDPTHGHEVGGGNYWTEGYYSMLDKAQ